jgi:hypothetical protein
MSSEIVQRRASFSLNLLSDDVEQGVDSRDDI